MKKLLYTLLAISIIYLASCSKDEKSAPIPTPTSNTQSIYSVLEINNSPKGLYNFWVMGDFTSIQVDSNFITHDSDNWSLLLPTGNPIAYQYRLDFYPENDTTGCADILIKTYNNNNLINTESFQIGFYQYVPNIIYCDNLVANNIFSKSWSIIAD
jgi:hypothetical protein